MRGCTFWKVVKNRRVHFKWVAGVGERRLEFLAGGSEMISQTRAQLMYIYVTKGGRLEFFGSDDNPDTRPVNVIQGDPKRLSQVIFFWRT